MSLIGVVIPLYNKKEYISRAIDSVLNQTISDFEIIVVDDGSTDQSAEVVSTYNDHRVRLVRQENAGPGAARNRGIEEVHADYLAFLDADDEWLPNYLERSYEILKQNPDCDICISGWYHDNCPSTGDKNKNIVDTYADLGIKLREGVVDPDRLVEIENALLMWWTGTVFLKKDILRSLHRFYSETKHTYGEDNYLWIQLAFSFKFYRNLEPLAWYHNDVSELASGGYIKRPLEAFLLWPKEVINNISVSRQNSVKKWLARYAISSAHNRLGVGQYENALLILYKIPHLFRYHPLRYFFLLIKLVLFKIGLYRSFHT
jgi:glycosyltransferase involved in cell wall biosynthesis